MPTPDSKQQPLELHPKFLSKNGNNESVVLPFGEFSSLMERVEDMEDILDLRAAKVESAGEEPVGLEEVKKELGLL